ncbi:amino acid ABC transporter substrate-binding protein [Rhizobiaceae bacterium BDR2-2]|uniref:Amino acid ABC transporter substrate-binding protein n=1 Tax=Ectorhizobium quercum TaxID=2965071 RepID=A0AAE3MZ00_9HYPH|nr:amino acid ABC transporter substrate-binding protein [Ectorhizobium quercum]MCX8996957.1 amino acid ABC transporter substrate-binding protein [Ectorhizobium quercum]
MTRLTAFFSLFSVAVLAAGAVCAEDTLERIARTGTITIGHRQGELPFSYVSDGEVTGYSTEICLNVIERMRRTLGLGPIDIAFTPVTTATRFIMIGTGKIDLECAATTNTAERRKLAEFSHPHFVTATRFVSRRVDGLATIADLTGRSVVSTTGTINVEQLNALNRERKLNISVILSRSHQEAFDMVSSGRVSAFVMDDILLAGLIASSPDPSAYVISREALSEPEPYGILMPPGDYAFKTAFNREMRALFESGEIREIYDRWFTQPMPPDGRNMNMPLASEMKEVLAAVLKDDGVEER